MPGVYYSQAFEEWKLGVVQLEIDPSSRYKISDMGQQQAIRIETQGPGVTVGICERCGARRASGAADMKKARFEIERLFEGHKCEAREDVNQAAARIIREATEGD